MAWRTNWLRDVRVTSMSLAVNVRQTIAEFVGMTAFVFVGTSAAVIAEQVALTALAFGVGVVVAAFSIGHISGCHLNPAITTSLLVSGNCGIGQALANVAAQCGGSLLASTALWGVTSQRVRLGANAITPEFNAWNALLGESIATCFLCFVVHMCAVDKNSPPSTNGLAPIAIGLTVFLGHSVMIPVDGCSINPARSLGPAVLSNTWDNFWVFVAGPLAGAIASVPLFYVVSQPWEARKDTHGRVVEDVGAEGAMVIESAV